MSRSGPSPDAIADSAPDLFESENAALEQARAVHASPEAGTHAYRQSLGELIGHFERLMRQTHRMIRHSDRAEREMQALNHQLQALAQQLEYRATHDALTGVFNRSAVIELSNQNLARDSAVMIVLDVDHFKRINDDYGHPTGDAVLAGIVACLRRIVGEAGILGRVGGEEFTVLLPGYKLDEAVRMTETMREAIAGHRFDPPVDRQVTASFGLSDNPRGSGFDIAYNLADAALYAAKRGGRNRVEVSRPERDAAT
ncbi:MAG TPA: GGDEF domain-containing protein [Bordetella sp.]